jgi:hypothetical protein
MVVFPGSACGVHLAAQAIERDTARRNIQTAHDGAHCLDLMARSFTAIASSSPIVVAQFF